VWVLGLLESKRVTGACALRIQPEDATVVEVDLRVFPREPVALLGIAPFSSMHLFGETDPHRFGDARPEVHDSDGLSMWTSSGERLFRPLRNPRRTKVSDYRLDSPRGFGLVQRDRDSASYQDPAERYQDRPSAWVEPIGDWGPGKLRLLEIATERESDDNIALAWVPDQLPREGLSVRYRLRFGSAVEGAAAFGHAVATRVSEPAPEHVRFEVDFWLPGPLPPVESIQLELSLADAELITRELLPSPFAGGVRARFEVLRKDTQRDLELRAFLRAGDDVLTETWSYAWQAKS
jgi:glucans biosynthesis protein